MDTIPPPNDKTGLKTVDRTFRIIEYIKSENGATLEEITTEFELAKSTIHRHLQTLISHGYVVREDEKYRLGLRFLDPAMHARNQHPEYDVIEEKVEKIASETGERAQFIIEENGIGIHVFSAIGENGIESESRVGQLVYLHATAAGKVILANLDERQVEKIIEKTGLPQLTDRTITEKTEFKRELKKVKEQGYAFNRAERRIGMQGIGVPIITSEGKVFGCISVTGPLRRMQEAHAESLPEKLLEIAEDIQLRFEYQH